MFNTDRQSEMSSPAANAGRDLDATVKWLRELSPTEMNELREALANQDAEKLSRHDTRFEACLNRSGRSQTW
ncbi:MAG: hypothetical protein ABI728_08880 [Betaproteobacteria bacterium]